jgi:hypothetical protein
LTAVVASPKLGDYYNLPSEIPAAAPAVNVEGAKYCVRLSDRGVANGLPFGATTPHICSAGNVAVGAATGIAGQGLDASIGVDEWYADTAVGTKTPAAGLMIPIVGDTTNTLASEYKPWGIPCYPT